MQSNFAAIGPFRFLRSIGRCNLLVRGLLGTLVCGLASTSVSAGDWPQILGSGRNGVAVDETLPTALPGAPLQPKWEAEIGEGYAGVAVAEGLVVAFHRQGDKEVVEAFRAETGERVWRTEFEAGYRGGINPDTGPRAVPTISGSKVVVWGAAGRLSALDLATGTTAWSLELFAEYRGDENYFGAGSAPLVIGQTVIVNVGGRRGAGVVGVDLEGGTVKWTATNEGTSYAAPTSMTIGSRTVALVPTRLQLVGLDPETGAELFRVPFGKTGPTVNAAVPLVQDDLIFLTAAYEIGAYLLKVEQTAAGQMSVTSVWENTESLSSQYFTPVLHQGFLYGTDGREDFDNTNLRCVELATGEVKWQMPMAGAHVILVGDELLVTTIAGDVLVGKAQASGFEARFETKLEQAAGRALPAFSNGCLFLRSNAVQGSGRLICLDLNP